MSTAQTTHRTSSFVHDFLVIPVMVGLTYLTAGYFYFYGLTLLSQFRTWSPWEFLIAVLGR